MITFRFTVFAWIIIISAAQQGCKKSGSSSTFGFSLGPASSNFSAERIQERLDRGVDRVATLLHAYGVILDSGKWQIREGQEINKQRKIFYVKEALIQSKGGAINGVIRLSIFDLGQTRERLYEASMQLRISQEVQKDRDWSHIVAAAQQQLLFPLQSVADTEHPVEK